ncbi:Apoptosis-inducing factor 1 [Fusarium oxysporum f. sp. albedinis]|nr:Apoptosis-inducing factor 1 [Fusarium oxysporum f. sp. albedinis]
MYQDAQQSREFPIICGFVSLVLSRIFLADVRRRHFHFIENRLLEVGAGRGDREPTDPSAISHHPFAPPHFRASISILARL